MAKKEAALLCHKSQVGEDVLKFVREFSEVIGKEQGYQYAEIISRADPACRKRAGIISATAQMALMRTYSARR